MHLLLLRWLCVPNVIYVLLVLFSTSLPLSGFLWVTQDDTSVSQVGRIFFKESGEKQTFFFSLFFTNYLCLSFYFSVSLLQSCCKFLAIQHPGVTSLMLTLNLVLCPRGAHFHRKYASFLLVPSQLDSTFTNFQLRGSSCYFLVPDGPRFQSENVRSTDCMSSIGHSVARLKTKTAIFEALQGLKWLHKNQNRGVESDKKP